MEGKTKVSTKKGMIAIGVVLIAIVGVIATVLVISQIKAPWTEERIRDYMSGTPTLEERVLYAEGKASELDMVSKSLSSKLIMFGCQSVTEIPSCNGVVDVANWDEFAQVIRAEIFPRLEAQGLDPCKLNLSIAPSDQSLYPSYDPTKDPRITDCRI